MEIKKRSFTITKIDRHTHNTKVFILKPKKPEVIEFKPGMFVTLSIEKDGAIIGPRSYSISSSPLMSDAIELTIQKVGVFTTALFDLNEGDEVTVQGPYGRFVLEEPVPKSVALLSGGTGIAPMMCMLRYILDKKLATHVTLIFSVRTQGDILHQHELEKRSNDHSNFTYIQTLTREPQDSNWQGHRGRISADMIRKHVREHKDAVYYMCGPENFITGMLEVLDDLDVPEASIHKEQWG